LFHFLIDKACRDFLGNAVDDRALRTTLARAFDHGDMAEASKPFKGGTLPGGMDKTFGPVPSPLRTIAATFIDLQENRHRADYDLAAYFRLQSVNLLLNRVEQAMAEWEAVHEHPVSRLYLILLLTWRQVKNKKI
jgi:hypothetical protein